MPRSETLISTIDLRETLKISHQQPMLVTPDAYDKTYADGQFGFLSLGRLLCTLRTGHSTLTSPDSGVVYLGTQKALQQAIQTPPQDGQSYASRWPGNELQVSEEQALLELGFSQIRWFPMLGYRLDESGAALCAARSQTPVDGFPGIAEISDPRGELTLNHIDEASRNDLKILWKISEF